MLVRGTVVGWGQHNTCNFQMKCRHSKGWNERAKCDRQWRVEEGRALQHRWVDAKGRKRGGVAGGEGAAALVGTHVEPLGSGLLQGERRRGRCRWTEGVLFRR